MKVPAKWLLLGLLLAALLVVTSPVATAQAPVTLTVYNPTGAFEVTQTFAARISDLNGKTICEISNDGWEYDRTFPRIVEVLQKQFPTAKFITYDKFPHGTNAITQATSNLGKLAKDAGCQAAIVGNAG